MVARCEVGSSPLSIRLNPVRSVPWLDDTLQNNRRTFPPSLGAKYRGLWKTCQENFASQPQNIRACVPKASIGSGTCAADISLLFASQTYRVSAGLARPCKRATFRLAQRQDRAELEPPLGAPGSGPCILRSNTRGIDNCNLSGKNK